MSATVLALSRPSPPFNLESTTAHTANTDDGACVHVRARGFWNMSQDTFFDVRVFYPNASSNCSTDLSFVYRKHELAKKREHGEVERGVFTPLVLSTTGGKGKD